MRIKSLSLTNYRGFASLTLDLDRPLTVIAGVNGSGKSSILAAMTVPLAWPLYRASSTPLPSKMLSVTDIRRGSEYCKIEVQTAPAGYDYPRHVELSRDGRITSDDDEGSWMLQGPSLILTIAYSTGRVAAPDLQARWKDGAFNATEPLDALDRALLASEGGFTDLFLWLRDREDYENAEKVSRASLAWSDAQLDAVRGAVTSMLPGFHRLRFDRKTLRVVVDKDGEPLYLDQLSDGERTLLAVVADIARRLAIANPDAPEPLRCEALVLIDEIELHLHPAWQRAVLGALQRTFPSCQFIVTTHSPQVLGEVPNDAVVLLDGFSAYRPPAPTEGRDANAILWEVLGVTAHPAAVTQELEDIADLLDETHYAEARIRLDAIAKRLTEHDPEVKRLRIALDVVEGLDPRGGEAAE